MAQIAEATVDKDGSATHEKVSDDLYLLGDTDHKEARWGLSKRNKSKEAAVRLCHFPFCIYNSWDEAGTMFQILLQYR